MRNRKITCELLAKACGKPLDVVVKDASRKRYFSPEVRRSRIIMIMIHASLPFVLILSVTRAHFGNIQEAIEYGLIDQVLESTSDLPLGLIPRKTEENENDLNMADVRGYSAPRYGDSADPDY